jgi:hypothetical protein
MSSDRFVGAIRHVGFVNSSNYLIVSSYKDLRTPSKPITSPQEQPLGPAVPHPCLSPHRPEALVQRLSRPSFSSQSTIPSNHGKSRAPRHPSVPDRQPHQSRSPPLLFLGASSKMKILMRSLRLFSGCGAWCMWRSPHRICHRRRSTLIRRRFGLTSMSVYSPLVNWLLMFGYRKVGKIKYIGVGW